MGADGRVSLPRLGLGVKERKYLRRFSQNFIRGKTKRRRKHGLNMEPHVTSIEEAVRRRSLPPRL